MSTNRAAQWETVIGLEVHAQLITESKMYCSCRSRNTTELTDANKHVCPVCLGHPGTLPRPNRQAVVRALTLAAKLGSSVASRNVFARKNYFYPDLPKGYQISQYEMPLARAGSVSFWHGTEKKEVHLVRMHLEEDTAKLFHQPDGTAILDYNRAGVPLLEIVTQPEFRAADECVAYLEELRSLLQRLGVSEAAMESGNFRCEPNVSVRPVGSDELRTKTELKNLNSFNTLRRAIVAEAERQRIVYERGGEVHQATLRYDEKRGCTVEMRRKETADDYRYFDDPDIPPLQVTADLKAEAGRSVRASAFELRQLMVEEDGISHEMAASIAGDSVLHHFYRQACQDGAVPEEVAKWVTGDLVRLIRSGPVKIEPGALSYVIKQVATRQLTLPQARQVFEQAYQSGRSCEAIITELGFTAADELDLEQICSEVIAENPRVVGDIKGGKHNAVQVLLGGVMKKTRGAADPQETRAKLLKMLGM
jgi:aspartyl-tRNA(Asn)/glutamyl-tRNA(Gln) amidotransferase subunit B